jgi:hypothetical protein
MIQNNLPVSIYASYYIRNSPTKKKEKIEDPLLVKLMEKYIIKETDNQKLINYNLDEDKGNFIDIYV